MSIMMVTSVNSYAKTMQMAAKWQKKQEENNYAPDNATSSDKTFQKQLDELRYPEYDRSAQMESDIELKMTAGKKLNGEEMQYLKTHNRSVFQMAKKIDRERTVYEKALASCTTKEEVEQLKADYASVAVKRINAIRNNSSTSAEKKQELLRFEHFRAASLDDAMHIFTDSPDYKHLPEGKLPQTDDADSADGINAGIGVENENQEAGIPGTGLTLKILQENRDKQAEAAEKAATYEADQKETDTKKKIPELEESTDDAAEEGSIMKAILDEEARWAKEDEENALASQNEDPSADGKSLDGLNNSLNSKLPIGQAKAAYLASQAYPFPAEASMIDIRK